MTPASASDLLSIVEAGVLAPSADNRHGFEIGVSTNGLLLFGNDRFQAAPYHRKLLGLISFGAVLENMVLRAGRIGYRVTVGWPGTQPESTLIAELRLTQDEPTHSALEAAIPTRHTNRRIVFSGPPLASADIAELKGLLNGIEGVAITFFDDRAARAQLLQLMAIAEAERFNTRALHDDLFSSIRFDVGWRASAVEGLPPGALGVEPGVRWAFALLQHWPIMNALRSIGIQRALGLRAAWLPGFFAPHCGVLTTRLPAEQGAARIGMALERLWLAAESRGLAFQPIIGAALLALPGYVEVPLETGKRLRHGWQALTNDTPLVVFRLGHARRPSVCAGRPPPNTYIRHDCPDATDPEAGSVVA